MSFCGYIRAGKAITEVHNPTAFPALSAGNHNKARPGANGGGLSVHRQEIKWIQSSWSLQNKGAMRKLKALLEKEKQTQPSVGFCGSTTSWWWVKYRKLKEKSLLRVRNIWEVGKKVGRLSDGRKFSKMTSEINSFQWNALDANSDRVKPVKTFASKKKIFSPTPC